MNNNKKQNIPNIPKFNLSWIYMLIAISLIVLFFANNKGSATKEVSYTQFQEYIQNGYVNKVIGFDDNSVEVY